jgi:hypothetical protein
MIFEWLPLHEYDECDYVEEMIGELEVEVLDVLTTLLATTLQELSILAYLKHRQDQPNCLVKVSIS